MADAATIEAPDETKSSKMPMVIGLVLLLAGGGAGFFATWSGMIFNSESAEAPEEEINHETSPKVVFIPLEPITVSLPQQSEQKYLRFRAQLEVAYKHASEVEQLTPRVIDVLNSYLRAIELRDIQEPSALTQLRAQMLRRVKVVTGPDRVKDLLIMEFVLN